MKRVPRLTAAQWDALLSAVVEAEVNWAEKDPRRLATLNRAWDRLHAWKPVIGPRGS